MSLNHMATANFNSILELSVFITFTSYSIIYNIDTEKLLILNFHKNIEQLL